LNQQCSRCVPPRTRTSVGSNGRGDCTISNDAELAVDLRFHSTPLSGSVPKVEEKPHIALVVTAEVEDFAPVHGGIEDPWQYPVVFEEVIGVWRLHGVVGQWFICYQPRNQLS
jgi:hypothetical protein